MHSPIHQVVVCCERSGGHTAELLALLEHMDPKRYSPRTYVVASTDRMGAQKARTFEAQRKSGSSVSTRSVSTSWNAGKLTPQQLRG